MRPMDPRAAGVLVTTGALTIASSLAVVALAPAEADTQGADIPMKIADRSLAWGQRMLVSGKIGADAAGRQLVLEHRSPGSDWRVLAQTTAGDTGRYRLRARLRTSGPGPSPVRGRRCRQCCVAGSHGKRRARRRRARRDPRPAWACARHKRRSRHRARSRRSGSCRSHRAARATRTRPVAHPRPWPHALRRRLHAVRARARHRFERDARRLFR